MREDRVAHGPTRRKAGAGHFFTYQRPFQENMLTQGPLQVYIINKPTIDMTTKTSKKKPLKAHRPGRESLKTITNRLYGLWSKIVKEEAGNKCVVCYSQELLNAHHIIPRQICSGLRFDVRNGICLCPSHHKFGKRSAHKNGLWFSEWMRTYFPEKHRYCFDHMDDELDCKDRKALYDVEYELHMEYPEIVGNLAEFWVTVVRRDGTVSVITTHAYNKRAAETLAACTGTRESPIKGILKTKKFTDCPVINVQGVPE